MAVTEGIYAPYAPPSAILDIVERHRNKGLPPVVDAAVLERSGISHSIIPRTLRALATLGLIDADGRPTSTLEGLRLAPEADYRTRLLEWLDAAYADVLLFAHPGTATESEIRDAFRRYQPAGQQARMVTLFLGLYAAAGVSSGGRHGSPPGIEAPVTRNGRSTAARTMQRRSQRPHPLVSPDGRLPAPVAGLLTKLPQEGEGWTRRERDQLMAAFGAVLDVCFPILAGAPGDKGRSSDMDA
jgi:hypothetical protein